MAHYTSAENVKSQRLIAILIAMLLETTNSANV